MEGRILVGTSTLAYLDCFSGISGDMLLGAMVDAGLDLAALRAGLAALPLDGYRLEAERIVEAGIAGTRVLVRLDGTLSHPHRSLASIDAMLASTALPERVRDRARAIFRRLGEAEARIHGAAVDEVEFHEVGAVDSLVDVVGAVLGLDLLGVDELYCSELPLTSGRVRSAHGELPVPAPATIAVLEGTDAVWRPLPAEGELVTPTGAAVVATLARFSRPRMTVTATGYGFGQKSLPWANCVRLVLGEAPQTGIRTDTPDGFEHDEIRVLEANIDNMTGEALGWLMDALLAAGALDVSYAPLQMKKNRPATLLTVLARPDEAARLAGMIVRESGTLGVRMTSADRIKAERRIETIETPLGPVRVKLKLVSGQVLAVTPEYDDCRKLAEQLGVPLETVRDRVTAAARQHFGLDR